MEHHNCPGYVKKYEDWTEDRHQRWLEHCEAIRQAKRNGTFYDENESGDYCEGEDNDWVECEDDQWEDDGDPMWE
jgi:hypothetical protein